MKLAVITGASSGIGREFARQLRENGEADAFWLVARRQEKLEELARELDCPCRVITADLATDEGVDSLCRVAEEEKPEVHYLINAAGFGSFGMFDEVSDTQVSRMIDLNVKAVVRITHRFIPYIVRGGYIIEMGSQSAYLPMPCFNTYAASKSFVLHYSKALSREIKPYGISVTCVCPGWVDTGFIGAAFSDQNVTLPKPAAFRPILKTEPVVRGALRATKRRRKVYVAGWLAKLNHMLYKLLPDCYVTWLWTMLIEKKEKKHGKNAL